MRAVLANEWKSRIGQVCSFFPLSGEELSDDHCRQLVQACFGDTKSLDSGVNPIADVRRSFSPPVLKEFTEYSSARRNRHVLTAVWAVRKSARKGARSASPLSSKLGRDDVAVRTFIRDLVERSYNYTSTQSNGHTQAVKSFFNAIRCMVDPTDYRGAKEYLATGAGRTKMYNIVAEGDTVQVLVSLSHSSLQSLISRRGVHILPTDPRSGKATFWIIVGIYKVCECPLVYAHFMPLVPCHANAPESQCVEALYELLSGPGEVVL